MICPFIFPLIYVYKNRKIQKVSAIRGSFDNLLLSKPGKKLFQTFLEHFSFQRSSTRSSPPEVFLRKGVLKICIKFTGEHLCRSVISIKLQSNFIEIALRYGCSPEDLLHIFRRPSPRNTPGRLLLQRIANMIFFEDFLRYYFINNLY